MASVLHGSARTTPRIRAELKAAKAPARLLATQYGLNVKTVLKWRNRDRRPPMLQWDQSRRARS